MLQLPSLVVLLASLPIAALLTSARVEAEPLARLDARQVDLGGELGRRYRLTIDNNLLAIDHEADFLQSFQKQDRKPFDYVGLGKELDAIVRFAHATQRPQLLALRRRIVDATLASQRPDGYIGIFPDVAPGDQPPDLGFGGRLVVWWDLHELCYLIQGLVSNHVHFGEKPSLDAARRAANYIMSRRAPTPLAVHVYSTGLETAFLALAEASGDARYRDYVNLDNGLARWQGDVAGHAYNQLSVCLAQLELYRQKPDPALLKQSQRVLAFLTAGRGLLVDGTASQDEGWHGDQADTGKTGETCTTAYLIRWLHRLMEIDPQPAYGDIMERAIFNALFAAQSPDGRELRKYTPLTGRREFYAGEPSSAFKRDTYCCPNNFRRIVAELPQLVYYRGVDRIVVNLYTESTLRTDMAGVPVTLRQQTGYPSKGRVEIEVEPAKPAAFALVLRLPGWCAAPTVTVNGKPAEGVAAGQFCTIERTWRAGDRVVVELPAEPRLVGGQGVQKGRAALLYGPLLFCLPGTDAAAEPPRLDFGGLSGPVPDERIRPGGLAFDVAPSPAGPPASRLTEFVDPDGRATFLGFENAGNPASDELLRISW